MQPAGKHGWPAATVIYDERDLAIREYAVQTLAHHVGTALRALNPAARMIRVETPTLMTPEALQGHADTGFDLVSTGEHLLRPETTWGTLNMLRVLWPDPQQRVKRLPACIWQAGKAYRHEQVRPFGELRFKEFYQCEFQLIVREGSHADYFSALVDVADNAVAALGSPDTVLSPVGEDDLAHYATRTTDIFADHLGQLHELAAVSQRRDLEGEGLMLFEASFGLDRIAALMRDNETH